MASHRVVIEGIFPSVGVVSVEGQSMASMCDIDSDRLDNHPQVENAIE